MKKLGNAYDLYNRFQNFKKKVEKEGFNFEKPFYYINEESYNITKLIPRYSGDSIIVGRIFNNRFLIVDSLPPSLKKDKERKRAFKQLEKIAKNFIAI